MNNKKSSEVSQKLSTAIVTIGQIKALSTICDNCVSKSSQMDANDIGNIGEIFSLISNLSSEVFNTLLSVEDTIE